MATNDVPTATAAFAPGAISGTSTGKRRAIIGALCMSTLLAAIETTIVATSLPDIVASLKVGDNYVWISNAYLLALTVSTPFYGQSATVFGRRWPSIVAVALFSLGSGICGGAIGTAMLIAGRLVQGIGSAGISVMTNIIIADLFPVRERGRYLGIVFLVFGLGIAIGPPLGGLITQHGHWRWIFWLNLPIGGVALAMQFFLLRLDPGQRMPFATAAAHIDWIGNGLLVGSVTAILIALSWAPVVHPWSSWEIICPLVLGLSGLVIFHIFESTSIPTTPVIPSRIFSNRTSTVALLLNFLSSMLTIWRVYFLPLYFRGALLLSSRTSGLLLLPTVLSGAPSAVLSGYALSRYGRYKPIHLLGCLLMTLATGLYLDLGVDIQLHKIIIYQIIAGIGGGVLLMSTLPTVHAVLPRKDMELSTATWGYLRAFGSVWGVAIPAAIFNNAFAHAARDVSREDVRNVIESEKAYESASTLWIGTLSEAAAREVASIYLKAMEMVWKVGLGFCVLALVITFLEDEVELRDRTESAERQIEATELQRRHDKA